MLFVSFFDGQIIKSFFEFQHSVDNNHISVLQAWQLIVGVWICSGRCSFSYGTDSPCWLLTGIRNVRLRQSRCCCGEHYPVWEWWRAEVVYGEHLSRRTRNISLHRLAPFCAHTNKVPSSSIPRKAIFSYPKAEKQYHYKPPRSHCNWSNRWPSHIVLLFHQHHHNENHLEAKYRLPSSGRYNASIELRYKHFNPNNYSFTTYSGILHWQRTAE